MKYPYDVALPFEICCQRFHYINDLKMKSVANGLRIDMREWLDENIGLDWKYNLVGTEVVFHFVDLNQAVMFKLVWAGTKEILSEDPVPRPESAGPIRILIDGN